MKNKYVKMQLLAIAVLLLGILTASAVKNPDDVCFRLNIKQGPWAEDTGIGINDGRWHANGAFVDAGTVHDDYQMIPDESKAGMLSYYTMTGRNGEMNIKVELKTFDWIGPSTIMFEGTWETDGGTGDYAKVEGSGTATQIIHLIAAMSSGEYLVGGPATAVHVTLEGTFEFLPAS